MISLIFIKLLLIFVSSTISQKTVQWNLNITTRTVEPLIREISEPLTSEKIKNQIFQFKTHFDIIIKQGTTFNLTVETPSKIEDLYFYCLADSPYEKLIILNLAGETNFTKTLTTNFDCVPMVSVSINVPVQMIIDTKNWLSLPIYNSNDVSLSTSQEYESEFNKHVQVYGFVQNYYIQILLSANDINNLKLLNYSLYNDLKGQINLIQYADYLAGLNDNTDKYKEPFMRLMDRTTFFVRSEKCNNDNSTQVSSQSILQSDNKSFNSTNNETTHKCPETNINRHFISAINYGINLKNLQLKNVTEDLKPDSPLMEKINKTVNVTFIIESPIDLTNFCLYLNNDCHTIFGKVMNIELLPNVYLVYISEKIHGNKYISDVMKYNISQIMSINVEVNEIKKKISHKKENNETELNNFNYTFDALGLSDYVFLKIFINYKNMTIELKQLIKNIHGYYDLYFSISLERNGSSIFEYKFFGIPENDQKLIKIVEKFQYNDIIHIFHAEPDRLNSNLEGFKSEEQNNNFLLSNKGLQIIKDNETELNYLKYSFNALSLNDRIFLKIFINYKTMTIELQQWVKYVHGYFNLYFSISLERNGSSIFEYKIFGNPKKNRKLIKVIEKFQYNDIIHIYHAEPGRLKSNLKGFNAKSKNNNFLLADNGLQTIN
ncbi:uncharacterized protein LOC127286499 [Leptopilina boulardi]|uniref:uncharacterized protein LOC127286499 n=1 Tax=Leptopilina boulardi TaxID=63433 RepID=UPI0021F5969D|nr:uncharacterized protein LOC127286499 [Leptopilina boulardi]